MELPTRVRSLVLHGCVPTSLVETVQMVLWPPKKHALVRFLPVPGSVGPFMKTKVNRTSLALSKSFF